jgi:phosphoglycolate phosphatase
MIKLVIFDMDGTLLNSLEGVTDCFNKALLEYNLPTFTPTEFGKFVGGDLEQVVSRLMPVQYVNDRKLIDNIKNRYRKIYAEYSVKYSVAYDGIKEVLEFLYKKSIKMAISTNKNQILTEGIVKSLFNYVVFDSVVGSEGGFAPKPSNESIDYIVAKAKIEKIDTIYVGDTSSDVKTAKNSDIKCLYAGWGQGKKEDKDIYNNIVICNSVNDMKKYFEENI